MGFFLIEFYLQKHADLLMSISNRIMYAQIFDTIHDILRSLSLAQSLLEGRSGIIWRSRNRVVTGPFLVYYLLFKKIAWRAFQYF